MTDPGPEDQLKAALEAARRQTRAERDESVADELAQTDRLIGSIDTTSDGETDAEDDTEDDTDDGADAGRPS
jgi:hypothetical protein